MFFFNSNPPKVDENMIIETETPIIKKQELIIEKKKNNNYNRKWNFL